MSDDNQIDSSAKNTGAAAQGQIDSSTNQIDSSTNQIDSSTNQIGETTAPAGQGGAAPPNTWSSMNLLSVDLYQIMDQILKATKISDAHKTEDMTYISQALGLQKFAKQFRLTGNLEMGIFYSQKASRTIDQLYSTRKDTCGEY